MAKSGEAHSHDLYQQILDQNRQMAEQNARMMQMMERFGIEENGSHRPTHNPEFIIESLASNIREIVYDPDNGLVFDRWYRKYEDLFLKDGAKLDDAAKVRLLLRSLSVLVHDKYVNFMLPSYPRDYTFDETVKKLKEFFGVRISLFSKRYLCFQLTKNDTDDFLTYAGTVNRCCEDFDLNNITADQFKSLIFICGLRSSKDADIRTRLLSKLEGSVEGEYTLESLITECQRLQDLKYYTALVEQKKSVSTICAVKQRKSAPPRPGSKDRKTTKADYPKTPCWQCGGMHYVRDCSYTKHVAGTHRRLQFLTVDIDGSQVTLQLDTASDITIISKKHPINLFGLDLIDLFGLWDTPLSTICNQVHVAAPTDQIQRYKAAFPDVFKPGHGHCKKMKSLDIIKPVEYSPWAAPIVAVKEPGGKVRICADYSNGLNAALEPNHYPLPVPDDIFSKLNGCCYFSIIDLSDAYLQVEVDDDSKQLLTINTHRGLFRFNRLAPGVKSALGAFQQLMNSMIADLEGVESFLDDVLVFSSSTSSLYSNDFKHLIKYLAHIVDAEGLHPDPSKVEAIVKMPPPKDVTGLRSFLGAVNFYGKKTVGRPTPNAGRDRRMAGPRA
ncbi:uncharacterized protein K02A2.6-like [Aedes albopictus]|uniref:Reverse transcriptase domain-containing protein n=1 Tax=Aedes albopictus TaxID=7160 RepID=A0ABM1YWE1_AEDAL